MKLNDFLENNVIVESSLIEILNSMNKDDIQFGVNLAKSFLNEFEIKELKRKLKPLKVNDWAKFGIDHRYLESKWLVSDRDSNLIYRCLLWNEEKCIYL